MKWLVLSLVFFFLLQLQCAQGASLAEKLQDDEQEIEDTGGEEELEDGGITSSKSNNETQDAHQKTDPPTQIGFENTTADSKQEKHQEDSSFHESRESVEHPENRMKGDKLASEEEIIGESSNITESTHNNTLKKNETMKRTLQTRLGVGTTIGGISNLHLTVGGSNSGGATGRGSSTSQAAGVDQQVGVGVGISSQQITTIRPSIAASSQTDISTGDQNWPYTSNTLNANLRPTMQGNLNTNEGGGIQSNQQQTRPSAAMGSSSLPTINNWPTYEGNFDTNPFTASNIQNNQQKTAPSTAVDSSASSTVNGWPAIQGSLNTNTISNGVIKNNQQQSRPTVATGSQIGIATTYQNRPSITIDSSASSTIDNWPKPQSNLHTNPFSSSFIQNSQQESGPSITTGSQAGVTTNQYSPSTTLDLSSSSTVNNWLTSQTNLNTNNFAVGAIQNNQQPTTLPILTGSQAGVTMNQNRPSTVLNSSASSTVNNRPTPQSNHNSNPFSSSTIQNSQQQTRPSIATGSQAGVTTNQIWPPSSATNSSASSIFNNWQTPQDSANTFAASTIQNNAQQPRPSIVAGSQVGVTTNQNRPAKELNSSTSSTINNWPKPQSNLNTTPFSSSIIQNSQQESRPSITTGSQAVITTNQYSPSSTLDFSASSTVNNWPTSQTNLNTNNFAVGAIQNNQQPTTLPIVTGSQAGVTINQNRPPPVLNSSASSTVNNWSTPQSNINTNIFTASAIQTNQQQITPSKSTVSQAVSSTNQNRPPATISSSAFPILNSWPTSQSNLNTNALSGSTIQTNEPQIRPSLTTISQAVVATNQYRPSTAINVSTSYASNGQSVLDGLNSNVFADGSILTNQQQSRPPLTILSQAGVTTNQYRPSPAINANTISSTNNWQSLGGSLNSNAFAGGTIQTNHQQTMPSLSAGSQAGVTTMDQVKPSTENNAYATSTANNWQAVNSGINTNAFVGGTIQNNQQVRPSLPTESQAGVTLNQYMPFTANGLSTNQEETSSLNSTSNNTAPSNQSETDALEPLTKVSQLMKVIEVISNATTAKVPGTALGREKGYVNISQGSHLKQNIDVGQSATMLNQQYNNVRPTNHSKRSLDDLTKIVQLLKVIEVISNATSDEEAQSSPEQYSVVGSITPTLIPYDLDVTTNSDSYPENGLSLNTQGNLHSNVGFTYRPTSDLGETLVSYVPNYQNNYIPNQTITTNYNLNQSNELSQKNQLTASAAVNVVGENTNNHYKQNLPVGQTTASAVANINFNNLASSEQVLNQGISPSYELNYLTASGNGQASTSTGPSSSGIKRRSLANLVKTVELLDAIETLANMNNSEQTDGIKSELITSNTNQQAALQNEATVITNLNSNAIAQISIGHYSPQEETQANYIQQRPSLTNKGEATQHVETDVKLSNTAEIRPAATINNQQNIRPTLTIQNSKVTGSLSAIPNYQQQTGVSMTGLAQAGIANQYTPNSAINDNSKTMLNNVPTMEGDYSMNQYNNQQTRPSVASQTAFVNNNQYRPFEASNLNSPTTTNNVMAKQDVFNINNFAGSNQYDSQQLGQSLDVGNEAVTNKYRPNPALNVGASITVNNLPSVQVGFDTNYLQQTRPSLAAGSQSTLLNSNLYMPAAAANTNVPNMIDNFATIGEGRQTGLVDNYQYTPNGGLNKSIENDTWKMQNGINTNGLIDFNQHNKQQKTPSISAGSHIGLNNNSLYRPNVPFNTAGSTIVQNGYNEYRPNVALNTNTTKLTNNSSTLQNNIDINNFSGINLNNTNQQIRPAIVAGDNTGSINYNQYRPSGGSNANVQTIISNNPTIQGVYNSNGLASQHGEQQLAFVNTGSQTGIINSNQYRPNVSINGGVQNITNHLPTLQGNINFNQYNEQQIRPSLATGSQTAPVNNQDRTNVTWNAGVSTTTNRIPTVQGETNMNHYGSVNQYNELFIRPSVATGNQNGLVNSNQYSPNTAYNANSPFTLNNMATDQGALNINDYDSIVENNQQQFRPSVANGIQSGVVNNQYTPNAAFNDNVLTTVNNLPTAQDGINMNSYTGVNQYNQHIAPSSTAGTQIEFINNQYTPNAAHITSATNHSSLQGGTNQQQFIPSVTAGTQTGLINNQYKPNTAFNLTAINNLPTAQGGTTINSFDGINQYNLQQMRPSVAAATQTGFGSNNQYRPNSALNTIATATTPTMNVLAGYNQQQIRPFAAAGSQAGILANNQNWPFSGLNTTGNSLGAVQDGLKVNQSVAVNQNNMQHNSSAENEAKLVSKIQKRPTAVINTNATANALGAIATGEQNKQQSQSSVNAESKINLNTTPSNNKPQVTQINTIPKDHNNLNQTLTQGSQDATKMNDTNQNTDINKQYGLLHAKNSSISTTEKQQNPHKTIENTGINLNLQQIKQSNAGKTQVGSVSSNQQVPSPSVNLSTSSPINNLLIPLVNPTVTTHVTTNQILPQVQAPAILNNPTTISEYNVNTSNYNSKLVQETSQKHTSETIRNQLLHSTPPIQGIIIPSTADLLNNYSQSANPFTQGGVSQVDVHSGSQIISSGKENDTSSSLNNNQQISGNTLSTELNVGRGASVTNTKTNNTSDKEETSRSLASDVQEGISSKLQSNKLTIKDSKTPGLSKSQPKVGSEDSQPSKTQTQGNTDAANSKILANNVAKEHKMTEEYQNKKTATSTAKESHNTHLITSVEGRSGSHVDCIKKEPLSNGSIAITTVGDCIMHQNQGDAIELENKKASGTSSNVKSDIPVNTPKRDSSLVVNGIANNKNEITNIATASSEASFNGTVPSIDKGKSEVTTSSGKESAAASGGLSLAVSI